LKNSLWNIRQEAEGIYCFDNAQLLGKTLADVLTQHFHFRSFLPPNARVPAAPRQRMYNMAAQGGIFSRGISKTGKCLTDNIKCSILLFGYF
jgi:hypothetical protein